MVCTFYLAENSVSSKSYAPREPPAGEVTRCNLAWLMYPISIGMLWLTDSSDAKKETSVAEIIFRSLVLLWTLEIGQFLTYGTSIGECISRKILQRYGIDYKHKSL